MMRLRRIFGALSFAATLSAQTATQPLQVLAIRSWSLAEVTRVAIETNGDFRYNSDRIQNPDRLFFDLVGATPHLGSKGIIVKQVGDKLLKRVRIAQNVPGSTRVVLDLEDNVEFTASQLGNPDRLMIELRKGHGTPASPVTQLPTPARMLRVETFVPLLALPNGSTKPVSILSSDTKQALVMPKPPDAPKFNKVAMIEPIAEPKQGFAVRNVGNPSMNPGIPVINPPVANPARRVANDGSRSLTRALGLKINRIVIDPGHGGHDQGTSGPKGLLEKDLVLDVSLRLGKLIEERMGSEVVYTRSDDTFIPLEERTAIANRKKADLFLSIHANSSPAAPTVAGVETYYLNFTTSSAALDVATRENASSDKTVYELQDLVQTITKHDKLEESREFASNIQAALQSLEIKNIPTAKDRGIRKAPFVVLIGAQMPSVLAEIGFLSNPREEGFLIKPEARQKLAEALYRGLSKYSQSLSHFDISRAASPQLPTAQKAMPTHSISFEK